MKPKYSFISKAEVLDKTGGFPARGRRFSCLSVLLVLLAVLLVLFWFSVYQMTVLNVVNFTIKIPVDLPMQAIPEPVQTVFLKQAKLFFAEILKNEVPEDDLIVTSDVINGLISQSEYLRGHMRVEVTPNRLTVKTSLPTDFLPGGRHRFFVSEHFVHVQPGSSSDLNVPGQNSQVHELPGAEVMYDDDFPLQWRSRPSDTTDVIDYLTGQFCKAVDLDNIFFSLDRPFGGVRFYMSNLLWLSNLEGLLISMVIFGKDKAFYVTRKETDVLKNIYNDPNTLKILRSGIERILFEQDRMIIRPRGRTLHTKPEEGERSSLWMFSNVAVIGSDDATEDAQSRSN